MRSLPVVAILLVLTLSADVAKADEVSPQPLSFADAVATALLHNPSYLASASDVDAAQARVRAARGPLAPSLTLSDSYQVVDPVSRLQTPFGSLPFSPNATNVPLASLGYTLSDGGARAARIARAEARFAAAQADRREAATATIGRVADAYYDLAAAIGSVGVADRSVAVTADHVRLAQQRLDAGLAARADLLEAQTQLADARVHAIDAHDALDRASNVLDASLGVSLELRYAPSDALDTGTAVPSLDAMLAAARTDRGELAAAREAVVAARRAVEEAKAQRAPRIGVSVGEGNVQPPVQSGFHPQFSLALNAVWTAFDNGVTAADVAVAQAGLRRASEDVERLQTSVELEVRQAYADVRAARLRIDAAQALATLARENLRLAEIRYRGGVGTILELRDAELQDARAREGMISARAGWQRSLAALRVAAGIVS